MFVSTLLKGKGHSIWSISPRASVYEALELMAKRNLGAVLVMDHQQLVGIFSERDHARKVALCGLHSRDTPVSQVMTREVLCVTPEKTAHDCMNLMTFKRVRHLPVIDQDKVVGVISIGDVVKSIMSEQEQLIEDLAHYISS